MEEVFQIADRVTVLRDGRWISTTPRAEVTPASRHPRHGRPRGAWSSSSDPRRTRGRSSCRCRDLGREGAFEDVSFELRAGEVLGFAGLVGARRTDVGLALFGIAPADDGHHPARRRSRSPSAARRTRSRLGIAYTTEDRRQLGLVFPLSIAANITLPSLPRFLTGSGLLRTARSATTAERFRERLEHPRPVGGDAGAVALSGGNQQKVVLQQVAGDAAPRAHPR